MPREKRITVIVPSSRYQEVLNYLVHTYGLPTAWTGTGHVGENIVRRHYDSGNVVLEERCNLFGKNISRATLFIDKSIDPEVKSKLIELMTS